MRYKEVIVANQCDFKFNWEGVLQTIRTRGIWFVTSGVSLISLLCCYDGNGSYQTLLHLLLPVCLTAVSLELLVVYFSPHNSHFSSLFESQACSAGQLMESRFFTHSGSFFPFSLYLYNTQFVIFLKPKKREVLSSSRLKSAAAY